ncbi:MAG: hypothetical protein AB7W59_19575, partial [Acidimicrobiia bacterium]
ALDLVDLRATLASAGATMAAGSMAATPLPPNPLAATPAPPSAAPSSQMGLINPLSGGNGAP